MHSPRADTEPGKRAAHLIQPRLALPSKQKIPGQEDSSHSADEYFSDLDTLQTVAVIPEASLQPQKDLLLEAMVEDIAEQITLRLPVIRLTPAKRPQADQQDVIVNTAGSAALAGVGNLMNAALKYVTNVVITNTFLQVIYGTYIAAYTSAMIIGGIAVLGLDVTMMRFLSAYRATEERRLAAGLIRFVIWTTLVSGAICAALFYLSATALAHLAYHKDAYALPFKEITLLIPLIALQLVFANGLQALKAIKQKVYVDRLIQPCFTLLLIGVFYLLGLRLEALILATICGFLASVMTGQILFHIGSRQLRSHTLPTLKPKVWLRFALPVSFYTLIQNVLNSTDILFLTAFATAAQVGLYAAAERASTFIVMPLFALDTIFSPLTAEFYARGEHEQLASLSRLVTKWSLSLCLPIFLCLCVFHEAILSIFSRGYTSADTVLIILSCGNLVNAGAGLTGSLLLMTGHTRVILVNSVATITANIGLAFLLVPHFNVTGAAIAAASATAMLDIAYFIEVYWILKICTLRWDILKPVAAGGAASIVGIALLHVIHVGYGYRAILGTLGLIIPFMLVYILALALLRLGKEDMMVFDAVLAKLGKQKHG